MNQNPLEPQRLVWLALVVLATFGLGVAMLAPPGAPPPRPEETPAPTPEKASLQCLDGQTFESIEALPGPPSANGSPTRGRWTIRFAEGEWVLDRVGVREAGRYRCEGAQVIASGSMGTHRGLLDAPAGNLAWDGQGFVRSGRDAEDPPAPRITGTGG